MNKASDIRYINYGPRWARGLNKYEAQGFNEFFRILSITSVVGITIGLVIGLVTQATWYGYLIDVIVGLVIGFLAGRGFAQLWIPHRWEEMLGEELERRGTVKQHIRETGEFRAEQTHMQPDIFTMLFSLGMLHKRRLDMVPDRLYLADVGFNDNFIYDTQSAGHNRKVFWKLNVQGAPPINVVSIPYRLENTTVEVAGIPVMGENVGDFRKRLWIKVGYRVWVQLEIDRDRVEQFVQVREPMRVVKNIVLTAAREILPFQRYEDVLLSTTGNQLEQRVKSYLDQADLGLDVVGVRIEEIKGSKELDQNLMQSFERLQLAKDRQQIAVSLSQMDDHLMQLMHEYEGNQAALEFRSRAATRMVEALLATGIPPQQLYGATQAEARVLTQEDSLPALMAEAVKEITLSPSLYFSSSGYPKIPEGLTHKQRLQWEAQELEARLPQVFRGLDIVKDRFAFELESGEILVITFPAPRTSYPCISLDDQIWTYKYRALWDDIYDLSYGRVTVCELYYETLRLLERVEYVQRDVDTCRAERDRLLQEAQVLRTQWGISNYSYDKTVNEADLERIYELTSPVLEMPGHETDEEARELLSWVAQERSLYAQTRRFLKNAGFIVTAAENTLIYQCTPTLSNLQDLLPATTCVRVSPDKPLDSTQVLAICGEVQRLDRRTQTVLVVTDQRPTDDGWAQIGTLGMKSFVILPIEQTLLRQGLLEGKEHDLLFEELEKRLGMDYDPYDIRDPIAGTFSFFGRNTLTQNLLRRIGAGKPVGIFGLRKMGKSSLLRALSDRVSFPIASMNLQGLINADLNELYENILRQWRQWTHVHYNLGYDLPQFDSGDATNKFMSATLELLNRLETSTGEARLGLFLDEAEVIVPSLDGNGPDLERYLALMGGIRELVDNDKRFSLAIASLNPSMSRINAWNGRQNPMFNRFQEVYLSPLAREDCIQMVRNLGKQVRQGGLDFTDDSVSAIVELSGGHPFLARQFCSLLYQQRNCQPGEITMEAIPAAVEHFIYDEKTIAHLEAGIWEDTGNVALWGEMQAHVNQAILLDLARANEPLTRENLLATPDADARRTALINLERFHFIHQPEPGFYALRYGLLRTWLRRRRLGLE